MNIGRTWKQKGTATCTKVRQIIPADIQEVAFALRKENQFKRYGEFKVEVIDFFKGYFVVVTKGTRVLSRALARPLIPRTYGRRCGQGLPAHIRGLAAPEADDGQGLRRAPQLERDRLRRPARAGRPPMGHEDLVTKFNRRRVWAFVRMGEGGGATATLSMPLAILAR